MTLFLKIMTLVMFLLNAGACAIYVDTADYGWAVLHGFVAIWMLTLMMKVDNY